MRQENFTENVVKQGQLAKIAAYQGKIAENFEEINESFLSEKSSEGPTFFTTVMKRILIFPVKMNPVQIRIMVILVKKIHRILNMIKMIICLDLLD